jgi:hypothetical protein
MLVATSGPSPRSGHAMVYHAAWGLTVLFGGADAQVWTWNGAQWNSLPIVSTAGSSFPALGYDLLHNRCILFGTNTDNLTRELQSNGDWAILPIPSQSSPSRRQSASIAYDSARARIILFGGTIGNGALDDCWEFNGEGTGSWQQRPSGPTGRTFGAMVYDPIRQRTVLQGGMIPASQPTALSIFTDTWEYDGASWTKRADDGPSYRASAVMAFDGASTFLFGGLSYTSTPVVLADTWYFNGAGTDAITIFSQSPPMQYPVPGQTVHFDINATGVSTYQWFRGTTPLSDGGTISGSSTPNLTISSVAVSDSATYTIHLTGPCSTLSRSFGIYLQDPNCYLNCDGSVVYPILNANDFQCFLNKYAAGDPYANCDGSTTPPVLNANDFQCFLNEFAAGCP